MSTPWYLQIKANKAPERLKFLKQKANGNWRKNRTYGFNNWEAAYCVLDQCPEGWYHHDGSYFRDERCITNNKGWYTDTDHDATLRGLIGRLPHGRFIAGYLNSDNDERVYFDEVFDDDEDAARMADEHARVAAEKYMDYSLKSDAAQALSEKIEEAIKRRTECLLLARINHNRDNNREEASHLKSDIEQWREELTDLNVEF